MELTYLAAAIAAVTSQIYLSPIPEVSTIKVFVTYITSNILLAIILIVTHIRPITTFLAVNIVFTTTAILLTLMRRLYFSNLSQFPGPKHWALSNLFKAYIYYTGEGSAKIIELHKQYKSDIIRVGPNELSIINVDAVEKVYKGKYPRGTFYLVGAINGDQNINTTRDYGQHAPWRRIWEKAFTSKAFLDYNPRVEGHVKKLETVIKAGEGEDLDVSKMMDDLVFDIMADLSFAHKSNLQGDEGAISYMAFIHKFVSLVGFLGNLRPLCELLPYLPQSSQVMELRRQGDSLLAGRQKLGSSRRDLFRHLLAEDEETETKFTQSELNSNAALVIVAGSDTTSSAMTRVLRALAKDERVLTKLQEEIDAATAEGEILTVESTKGLQYLLAVINEGLRLMNPVPSGAYAASPPSGLTVAGTFIPGNVQIFVSPHGLMTDERYFAKAHMYIPERWTDEWPEGVKDRRAYIPFSYGAHSCVGRQLALNEMRLIIATIVKKWDLVLSEKYDEVVWKEAFRDHAILKIGSLWLNFVPRT